MYKKYYLRIVKVLIFLIILLVINSSAEEPSRLSLREVLKIAFDSNSEVITARKELESAKAGIISARAISNPEFGIEFRPSGIESSLSQELSILGKRGLSRRIADTGKEISECNLDSVWMEVSFEVKKVYYQILLAEKKKEFSVESLELARNFLDRTSQRYNVGKVLKNELLRAEIEVFRAQNEIMLSDKEISSNKDKLNFLFGRPSYEEYECTDKLVYSKKELDLDTLIKQALMKRADIKAKKLELKSSGLELKLARRERLSNPTFSLLADRDTGQDFVFGAGVEMPLPLWYRNKGEISAVKSEGEKTEHQIKSLKNRIELEVKEVYREIKLADRQVALMKKSVKKASELLSLIEVQYAEGKTTFLSYLEALMVYREANLDYLEAILDYRVKLALLENRTGGEL